MLLSCCLERDAHARLRRENDEHFEVAGTATQVLGITTKYEKGLDKYIPVMVIVFSDGGIGGEGALFLKREAAMENTSPKEQNDDEHGAGDRAPEELHDRAP